MCVGPADARPIEAFLTGDGKAMVAANFLEGQLPSSKCLIDTKGFFYIMEVNETMIAGHHGQEEIHIFSPVKYCNAFFFLLEFQLRKITSG